MVVRGGYANSEAAAKVWRLLQPGGRTALRKIVRLEFPEADGKPQSAWEVARVPLILIIQRAAPREADEIELYVPTRWPSEEPPTRISYRDFFDARINPRVGNSRSPWGDRLPPLLRPEDVPLLCKIFPNRRRFVPLRSVVRWTYGIQRGGADMTEEPTGERPIQVVAGRSLAVAWPGDPEGWLDLD
jgi:hypothetical protein